MRTVLIAVLLAALAASASAADAERWIFVGSTSEPTYREDLDGQYEATFIVRRQLAGSPLPRRPRVLLAVPQMPHDAAEKQWFVVARRGPDGALSAGHDWRWIEKGRLCLWPDDIAEFGLASDFAKATLGEGGRRCIKV